MINSEKMERHCPICEVEIGFIDYLKTNGIWYAIACDFTLTKKETKRRDHYLTIWREERVKIPCCNCCDALYIMNRRQGGEEFPKSTITNLNNFINVNEKKLKNLKLI